MWQATSSIGQSSNTGKTMTNCFGLAQVEKY